MGVKRMERRTWKCVWVFRDGDDKEKDGKEDKLFAMVVIRVQDGEEDFELFAMGTIRVKDGEEDALVLMRSDCWMGLRGWEGLRLTGSYETGVEFSHPRNGMVRGQVRERRFDGIGCRMDMRG
jgi:hypothetical protein